MKKALTSQSIYSLSLKIMFAAIMAGTVIFGLIQIWDLFLSLLIAVVLASVIESSARSLEKLKVPRVPALIAVYFGIFAVVGVLTYLVVPTFISEVSAIAQGDGGATSQVRPLAQLYETLRSADASSIGSLVGDVRESISSLPDEFTNTATGALVSVTNIVLILMVTFYLSVTRRAVDRTIRALAPKKKELYASGLWQRVENKIIQWVKGQLLQAFLLAILTYIGLVIIGVPYPLLLSFFAAIMGLVPFGIIIAGIVAIIVAWVNIGSIAAIIVFGWYMLLQFLENNVFQPLIIGRATGVPPLLILISVIVFGTLWGVLGVVLAIPIAVLIVEVVRDYEISKIRDISEPA